MAVAITNTAAQIDPTIHTTTGIYRTLHIRNAAPAPIRTGIVAAVTATTISCHLVSTFSSPVHLDQPPLMMATAPKSTQAHTMKRPSHMT
jgi:hypothetical protein